MNKANTQGTTKDYEGRVPKIANSFCALIQAGELLTSQSKVKEGVQRVAREYREALQRLSNE